MTAPDNNDAALVRRYLESPSSVGYHQAAASLDRLAATAERADEAERLATENGRLAQAHWDRAEDAEAALLVAQQERDEWKKKAASRLAAGMEQERLKLRAEATITRLREALERIADSHASFTEMQEAARAALAQDAEHSDA